MAASPPRSTCGGLNSSFLSLSNKGSEGMGLVMLLGVTPPCSGLAPAAPCPHSWDSPEGDGLRLWVPPRTLLGGRGPCSLPLSSWGWRTPLRLMQAPGALCNSAAAGGHGRGGGRLRGPAGSHTPGSICAPAWALPPACTVPGRVFFPGVWGCGMSSLRSCGSLLLAAAKKGWSRALEFPAGLQIKLGMMIHVKWADWDLC